jgi:ZIP family zinc transporter
MSYLFKTTLIGLFFGTFGTTLGGIIGVCLKTTSNRFLSFILSFASGLMLSIVCFDLIPESMDLTSILNTVVGVILGVICMIICDILVQKRFNKININVGGAPLGDPKRVNNLLKTGIIVSIGLALHNFPEGLAIGSGFDASITLGYSLALAICLHDIPEGIAMGVPMKSGGMKVSKIIFFVIMSGITTGIGAFFGALVGTIGKEVIAMCLAFAGGAMLYIVSGELIPESKSIYKGRFTSLGNILGIILGLFAHICF